MLRRLPVSAVLLFFIIIAFHPANGASAQSVPAPELPRVLIIATGGTIAGEQGEPGTLGGYEIRKTVNEIVAQVPALKRYAQVETEQFSNVPSASMAPEQWLQLA